MEITLYDYQKQGIKDISASLKVGDKRVLYQLPTGGGKSYIFCSMAKQAIENGWTVIILTDRNELQEQAAGSLRAIGTEAMLINPSNSPKSLNGVLYCVMAQTLVRRLKKELYQDWLKKKKLMVIIDEAHVGNSDFIHQHLGNKVVVIGVTGTPVRMGKPKYQLGSLYSKLVIGPSVRELIAKGRLTPCKYYGVPLDTKGLKVKGGDFAIDEVIKKMDKPKLYSGAVKYWNKHAKGLKTIAFSAGIKNSIALAKEFNEAGIKAVHMDSDNVTKAARKDLLARFKRGEFTVLCKFASFKPR